MRLSSVHIQVAPSLHRWLTPRPQPCTSWGFNKMIDAGKKKGIPIMFLAKNEPLFQINDFRRLSRGFLAPLRRTRGSAVPTVSRTRNRSLPSPTPFPAIRSFHRLKLQDWWTDFLKKQSPWIYWWIYKSKCHKWQPTFHDDVAVVDGAGICSFIHGPFGKVSLQLCEPLGTDEVPGTEWAS